MADDLLRDYGDVYQPDTGPQARGLEFHEGWLPIVQDYCERLRGLRSGAQPIKLRWAKEKFGSLKLFTSADRRRSTVLQQYHIDYTDERARRASLRFCDRCGKPGRARWGTFLATLCDDHVDIVGPLRPEDGKILDPDRERLATDGTIHRESRDNEWTDEELGLETSTWDCERLFRLQYRP